MKKILSVALIFMVLLYAMPIITVGIKERSGDCIMVSESSVDDEVKASDQNEEEIRERFDKKTKVKVLIDGKIKEISVYEYLVGVVAAEMPASFPVEALKAQTVAARSYMMYKINLAQSDGVHNGVQLCDDFNHCTAFYDIEKEGKDLWGKDFDFYSDKIKNAVESTDGIVATYDGEAIAAVFHSSSGDYTESAKNVWGNDFSYLVSVPNVGGKSSPEYYGAVVVEKTEFAQKMNQYYKNINFTGDASNWFSNIVRSDSGNIISLKIGGVVVKGTELRKIWGLNSTNFVIEISDNEIIFNTTGTGHGVGMSQYGAREMALNGSCFDEIICHYYNGVQLMVKN